MSDQQDRAAALIEDQKQRHWQNPGQFQKRFAAKEEIRLLDDLFLKTLADAMQREPETTAKKGEQAELCRPHWEACKATDRSFQEFVERLESQWFARRYTAIMGPPPPAEELTYIWIVAFDSHINNAKQGHAASIQFLLKHLDNRFKSPRAGRPTKKAAAEAKSNGSSDAALDAIYDGLMG